MSKKDKDIYTILILIAMITAFGGTWLRYAHPWLEKNYGGKYENTSTDNRSDSVGVQDSGG